MQHHISTTMLPATRLYHVYTLAVQILAKFIKATAYAPFFLTSLLMTKFILAKSQHAWLWIISIFISWWLQYLTYFYFAGVLVLLRFHNYNSWRLIKIFGILYIFVWPPIIFILLLPTTRLCLVFFWLLIVVLNLLIYPKYRNIAHMAPRTAFSLYLLGIWHTRRWVLD
jgi:hypothetical protein